MPKKKILIFIDWYLPGYKAGGPIQSVANLVAHLKDEFDFFIITRDTDYSETIPYSGIKANEWNTRPDGTHIYYISGPNLTRSTIRSLIRRTEFESVYLNGIYSLYFTLIPLLCLRKKRNKKVVIAARGMLSEGSLNVKSAKKQFFIRAVKVLKLFDNVLFHATTPVEKEEIRKVFGEKIQIQTAANLSQRTNAERPVEKMKAADTLKLVNIARIAPEKNLLLALKILKDVNSDVIFDFYGPVYDQGYWNECKAVLDELPQNIRASYKGSIESEKVQKTLNNYHFMFMPTTGENFGHIILQSLSAGCPVIISDQTPWKNLENKNIGWEIPLNDPRGFAKLIDECSSMNQMDYDKMSNSAFEHAKEYINNPAIVEQNRHLFQ